MRTIAGVCLPAYSAIASCGMITYGVRPLPAISAYVDVISATQPWGVDLLVSEPGSEPRGRLQLPLGSPTSQGNLFEEIDILQCIPASDAVNAITDRAIVTVPPSKVAILKLCSCRELWNQFSWVGFAFLGRAVLWASVGARGLRST